MLRNANARLQNAKKHKYVESKLQNLTFCRHNQTPFLLSLNSLLGNVPTTGRTISDLNFAMGEQFFSFLLSNARQCKSTFNISRAIQLLLEKIEKYLLVIFS